MQSVEGRQSAGQCAQQGLCSSRVGAVCAAVAVAYSSWGVVQGQFMVCHQSEGPCEKQLSSHAAAACIVVLQSGASRALLTLFSHQCTYNCSSVPIFCMFPAHTSSVCFQHAHGEGCWVLTGVERVSCIHSLHRCVFVSGLLAGHLPRQ